MRRSALRTATALAGAIAFLTISGCSSEDAGAAGGDPAQVDDLDGVWSGTFFTGSVAVITLAQEADRVIGSLRIMEGPPSYDVFVTSGTFDGRIVGAQLAFEMELTLTACRTSYRGTAVARRAGARSVLELEYTGVSMCGYPTAGRAVLQRLDGGCLAGLTACVEVPSPYCAELEKDPRNCGHCGFRCPEELTCRAGECVTPPTPPCTAPLALEAEVAVGGLPTLDGSWWANDLVLADLNGDGHLDAAVAHGAASWEDTDAVSVLLNDGGGTLLAGGTLPAAMRPVSLAVADFDGDGDADLAAFCADRQWDDPPLAIVHVFPGNGDGTFGTSTDLAAGTPFDAREPTGYDLAAADLDGDGRADLAVLNPADDTLTVFLATEGGFAAPVTYAARGARNGIVATDLDGDGRVDVVIGTHEPSVPPAFTDHVLVFRGSGDGTLGDGVEVPGVPLGSDPGALFAADLDRDGDADLLQLGAHATSFVQAPDGTFAPSEVSPSGRVGALADFDGDGKLDVVTLPGWEPAHLAFCGGAGDGSFLPEVLYHLERDFDRVAAGDLDGDGRPDLVLAGGGYEGGAIGRVSVMLSCSP